MKNLLIIIFSIPLIAYGQLEESYLEVIGYSTIQIVPERVKLSVIFNEKENLSKPGDFTKIDEKLQMLLELNGLSQECLYINHISASGDFYSYTDKQTKKIRFSKIYNLKIEASKLTDSLIFDLFEAGADNVVLTDLESDQLDHYRQKVLKDATIQAKNKAKTIAQGMSVELDKIIEIIEVTPNYLNEEFKQEKLRSYHPAKYADSYSYGLNWQGFDLKTIELSCMIKVKYSIL